MKELRYTLLSDGSSDKALMPILTWLLLEHNITAPIQSQWADLRRLRNPPNTLAERMKWSVYLYPCDLLFVHRDAETESVQARVEEIEKALEGVKDKIQLGREGTVCVVPVRMTEAWLLLDEKALRLAAGNPHGRRPLSLPSINEVENLPDPKGILYRLLHQASGLSGRRLKRFRASTATQRITDFISDFSPLRALSAFQTLEREIKQVVRGQRWASES